MGKVGTVVPIVVVGHPKSGTKYMSALLQCFGLDVQHEKLGVDGISSWQWAVVTNAVPFSFDKSSRSGMSIGHLIHVLRDPYKVVSSAMYLSRKSEKFRRQFVLIYSPETHPVIRTVQSYIGWNRLIRAQQPDLTVAVEDCMQVLYNYLRDTGLSDGLVPGAPMPSKNLNTVFSGSSRNAHRERMTKKEIDDVLEGSDVLADFVSERRIYEGLRRDTRHGVASAAKEAKRKEEEK